MKKPVPVVRLGAQPPIKKKEEPPAPPPVDLQEVEQALGSEYTKPAPIPPPPPRVINASAVLTRSGTPPAPARPKEEPKKLRIILVSTDGTETPFTPPPEE